MNKLIVKYKTLSAPVKASLWFTICSVLQKGITLMSTPIFTRLLTTEQYGVYSVYQSWYSIISIFATLNLSAGVLFNGLTKFKDDRDRLISSFMGLSSTVTFGLFLIYICALDFWNNLFNMSTLFMSAMFIELLVVPAYAFWAVKQRYDYKYKTIIILTLLVALGSPVLGIISVLATEYKAEARVLSYVSIQIIQGLFFYIYNMSKGKKFYVKEYWKYALKFNLPLIPHYLSMTLLNQADRIMIANMIGKDAAAIYSVAYQISMMMTIVTNAINNSFVPYTYKQMKERKYGDLKRVSNLLIIMIGIACIIAMIFGPEVIRFFAAKEYYNAIWIIPPVAASVYFIFLYSLFANIEFYYEKTKYVMIASCGGAVINIILNFILIPIFGYFAAGYTTLFCYILFSFAHFYFYIKILRGKQVEEIYNRKFIILFSSVLIIAMLCIPLLYTHMIIRYTLVVGIIFACFKNRKMLADIFSEIKKK